MYRAPLTDGIHLGSHAYRASALTLSCSTDLFPVTFWALLIAWIHTLILQNCLASGQSWNGVGFYQSPESCLGREANIGDPDLPKGQEES